jgi:hypothetical protein
MEDDPSKAQHYCDQAVHTGELAVRDTNEETRAALLSLADNYERLCLKFLKAV